METWTSEYLRVEAQKAAAPPRSQPADRQALSFSVSYASCLLLCGLGAITAVLCHAAQVLGISFRMFAVSSAVAAAGVLVGSILLLPGMIRKSHADWMTLAGLLALVLFSVGIHLTIHTSCSDDIYYCSNAVYHLQHPDEPMSFQNFALAMPSGPGTLYFAATSVAHEYAHAAIAWWLGVEYGTAYYVIGQAIIGALLPMAFYCTLYRLIPRTQAALVGTFAVLLCFLATWDTVRAPGQLAFLLSFLGKCKLLVVLLPWYVGLTLAYFERPTFRAWMALFITATAAAGLSSTAIITLPALSFCLIIASVVSGKLRATEFWKMTSFLAAPAYLVVAVLFMLKHRDNVGPQAAGFPVTFFGHLRFFAETHVPITAVLFFTLAPAALWLLQGSHRRFFLGWFAAAALFLNPVLDHWIIFHVTTPNIYWRLFYVLPFPLVVGMAGAAVYDRAPDLKRRTLLRGLIALLVIDLGVGYIFFRTKPSVWTGRAAWAFPPADLTDCRRIIAIALAGPMLAPEKLAWMIPVLSSRHPQVSSKQAVEFWLTQDPAESARRINAEAYVEDSRGGSLHDLALVLEGSFVKTVVLKSTVARSPEAMKVLDDAGFTKSYEIDKFVVRCRP